MERSPVSRPEVLVHFKQRINSSGSFVSAFIVLLISTEECQKHLFFVASLPIKEDH